MDLDTNSPTYMTPPYCQDCVAGKMARQPFITSDMHTEYAGELIHSYLAGPMQVEGHGHKRYIATYLCDKSGYSWVFSLSDKSQQLEVFKTFHKLLTTQTACPLKYF